MNLFDLNREKILQKNAPLAVRMRPISLDTFYGQEELVGKGKILRKMIESDQLSSIIFYGPPGTGKTTLAKIIATTTKSMFKQVNAVTSGVADLRSVIKEAKEDLGMYNRKTIVFIDEIHRFNKAQQDALLPDVEEGIIILIGSTTENPMFSVNKALLSRSKIFAFQPLSYTDLHNVLDKALKDSERGLGQYNINISEPVIEKIIYYAAGDARVALNNLEMMVLSSPPDTNGIRTIKEDTLQEVLQKKIINYEKNGDEHYSVISAFIKSMRGSDPQAAVYWLARMLYAGEEISFIARRLVIFAAEDVGLADANALVIANAASQAVERIGLPEARIILSEAVIYLSLAEKSNSAYMAIDQAMQIIEHSGTCPVPLHLREGSAGMKEKFGYGRDYKYPHNYDNHWVKQQYLPDEIVDSIFYQPSEQGNEKELADVWKRRKKAQK